MSKLNQIKLPLNLEELAEYIEQEIITRAQTLNGFVSNIQQSEPVVKVTNKKI